MTMVKIVSGNNGSGKSLFLSKLYSESDLKKTIFVSDFTIFYNISTTDLIKREMSKGQYKLHMLLKAALAVVEDGTLIIDDIDTYLHPDVLQNLITDIINKNHKIRNLIISTHSPMLIMKNWQDCVINVEDYNSYNDFQKEFI